MSRNTFEAKGGRTLRDPTPQIKSWIDNNEQLWKFWERTAECPGLCGLQNKTQAEAKELSAYYKGRFDLALGFEQFFKE